MSFGQECPVLTKSIVMLRSPVLQPNKGVYYSDQDSNTLVYGKVLKTAFQERKYEVECHLTGQIIKKIVDFDSLRIMPVPFFKNFEYSDIDFGYKYRTLIEGEGELLSYDHPLLNLN